MSLKVIILSCHVYLQCGSYFHQRENCDMWTHTIRPNEKIEYVYDTMEAEGGRMMSHSLYIQNFLQWAACFNL